MSLFRKRSEALESIPGKALSLATLAGYVRELQKIGIELATLKEKVIAAIAREDFETAARFLDETADKYRELAAIKRSSEAPISTLSKE
ncbi:MAG: hypothetical protein ACRD4S_01665 [Candidatus Acidiferrales bacterium]